MYSFVNQKNKKFNEWSKFTFSICEKCGIVIDGKEQIESNKCSIIITADIKKVEEWYSNLNKKSRKDLGNYLLTEFSEFRPCQIPLQELFKHLVMIIIQKSNLQIYQGKYDAKNCKKNHSFFYLVVK